MKDQHEADKLMLKGLKTRLRNEREQLRIFDRLNRQINVKVWPEQVVGLRPLDIQDGRYRSFLELRKLAEGKKQFLVGQQEPESMLRDVGNFRLRGDCAKRF